MFPILPESKTELELLTDVDVIIVRSVTAGDPLIACNYGLDLQRSAAIKGLALAKLLHGMRSNWEMYQAAGVDEDFEDFVQANMGVSPQTARKYSDMWRSIFASDYVPDEIKLKLQSKPIKELLLLTAAVEEGSLTEDELETVVVADETKIREMVRSARGKEATSSRSAVYIAIVMRDGKNPRGTIIATQDGISETIGYLNMDTDIKFVNQAIERIKNSAHMLERE